MTTIRGIQLTCPNCQAQFDTRGFGSTNSFGGQTTDFREIAAGMQARPFAVHTCAACGFTGECSDFEEPVEPEVSRRIAAELAPLVRETFPSPWRRFEYAALISRWRGEDAMRTAHLYLSAAWCLSDEGAEDGDGQRYRCEAIEHFRRALDGDDLADKERPVIIYLIGELYRRTGEPATAAGWFDRVADAAGAEPSLQWVVQAAQQQKTDPRELLAPRLG